MKKIIFCLQTMVRGGVEKELLTLLKCFDYSQYEVTLLLLYRSDENIISEIPSEVKFICLNINKTYYCSGIGTLVKSRLKSGKIFESASLVMKRMLNLESSHTAISLDEVNAPDEEYDVAICYHVHSPIMIKYVATKIEAKRKIGWMHNDFIASGFRIKSAIKYLNIYDELVAVSNQVKNEFMQVCPEYLGKLSVAHNIVDVEEIVALSLQIPEDSYFTDNHIKVLSVGRFTEQKGFDIAIEVAKVLRDKGVDFRWYLIGYGDNEIQYRNLIRKYKLTDIFVILGEKKNPYPYIANCDIYVQPSRHEAWGLVVHEARVLHKPILVSKFAGSDEQIVNGKTGYIVSISEIDKFIERLEKLILDQGERERLENNLRKEGYSKEDLHIIMSKFS